MLDLAGLPKNANGFRTTHTCELCGFEPKTKNKYREKQDHLVMKHFKERIDKIFPHCRPYSCPNTECEFAGKDKQALLRHYTGKHGVLELFLREALLAKGITYHLSDSAKRKSMGNTDSNHRDGGSRKEKQGRLSPSPEETVLPQGSPEGPVFADTTTILPSEYPDLREPLTFQQAVTRIPNLPPSLPTQPTTKLPSMASVFNSNTRLNPTKAEVEMMLATNFHQPSDYHISSSSIHHAPSTSPLPLDSAVVSSTTMEDFFLPTNQETNKLLLNDNIMWGGGNSGGGGQTESSTGSIQYLDTNEHDFINLEDIAYEYLYPASVDPSAVQPQPSTQSGPVGQSVGGSGGPRLLSFENF